MSNKNKLEEIKNEPISSLADLFKGSVQSDNKSSGRYKQEKVGNYKCDTTIFCLKKPDEALVKGYDPAYPVEIIVADIAQKTNWAMDPDKPEVLDLGDANLEREIKTNLPKSATYPIENGDLVQITAVGYVKEEEGNKTPVSLSESDIERNLATSLPYEIMEENGSLKAKPFFFGSEEIKRTMESLLPERVQGLVNNIAGPEEKVLRVYVQLKKHIKYSKKEAIRKMNDDEIAKVKENDDDARWYYEMQQELRQSVEGKAAAKISKMAKFEFQK